MPEAGPVTFGRYMLEARLARGGMGEVFLARMQGPAGFEKKVVIKRILPHLAESTEFVERFLDEGRLVVQLTHGNIAQVFDMGNVDGTYFLAMEHVDGTDMRRFLRHLKSNKSQLPIGLALHIVSQSARGLSYAHSRQDDSGNNLGIIHRDVSPSNMMLSRHGEIKLLDFGIAKATSRMMESISGSLHGKFLYMSPEQASGLPLDHRSDLFSLGTCAYEFLTGTRPFNGDNDLHTLELVRKGLHEKPTVVRPEIPGPIEDIIERCLSVDPADRFESAEHVHQTIQEVLVDLRFVVTNNDLASFAQPHIDAVNNTPVGLDAALNQQLDALLSPSPINRTQMVSPPADVAFDDTQTGTPEGDAIRDIVSDTATSRSRVTPAPPAPVPRASRLRILLGSILLVLTILVVYNMKSLDEEQYTVTDTAISTEQIPSSGAVRIASTLNAPEPEAEPNSADSPKSMGEPTVPPNPSDSPGPSNEVSAPDSTEGSNVARTPGPPANAAKSPASKPAMTIQVEQLPKGAVIQMDGKAVVAHQKGLYRVPDGDQPIQLHILAPGYVTHVLPVMRQPGAIVPVVPNLVRSRRRVVVRSDPPGAEFTVQKKVVGVGSKAFTVHGNQKILVKASLQGYRSTSVTIDKDTPPTQIIRLREQQSKATFSIRVFPANAVVTLNNKLLQRSGNLITRTVPTGKHTLSIRAPDGTTKRKTFSLKAGENKLLGTLELAAQ